MPLIQYIVDNENCRNRLPRPRIFRDRTNPLDVYDDLDILRRFRMTRDTVVQVIDLISEDITHPTDRNRAISPTLQTMCALRYYATGNFQRVSGDIIGISQPSVSRIVNRVTIALCAKAPKIIRFPTTQYERNVIIRGFYEKTQFPGCLVAWTAA